MSPVMCFHRASLAGEVHEQIGRALRTSPHHRRSMLPLKPERMIRI